MRLDRPSIRFVGATLLGGLFAVATVATASAQEAGESGDEVGSSVTSFGAGDWFSLGIRLALVVAVIWGAVHAMRWYVRRMNHGGSRGSTRALEVLETHALGPNRTLHLVRLGDRAVLVGVTQERITQLLTVDDPEEFKRLTTSPEEPEVRAPARASGVALGAMSLLGSLRTGLVAMRARQSEMNERRQALKEQQGGRQARPGRAPRRSRVATAEATEAPRFGALKGMLARSTHPAPRTSEEIIATAEQERESLFDRTLASIDAVEVMPNGSTAAGPRARASYGQARQAPPAPSASSREEQIAELQRAIAAARRNAS
ncbi:MAG: flagellar biosynthetic protein FliO [Dehalococcoidia bacterium]|nr:flagellar biosynthetic protein FliO [Dehalococcoidia bacterium]